MYIYLDKNGVVKEIVNDEALRQTSSNANTIHVYYEGYEEDGVSRVLATYELPDSSTYPESGELEVATSTTKEEIPYNAERDLKYFKYYTDYDFYAFKISDEALAQDGVVRLMLRFVCSNNTYIKAQGLVCFNVEAEIAQADYGITVAQYNELVKLWYNEQSFLPLDGSATMMGDLKMGSNRIKMGEKHISVDDDGRLAFDGNALAKKSEVDGVSSDLSEATASLQSQIDTINATQNVVDIVGTYAQLAAYSTTNLLDNDKIEVLVDESQSNANTIYSFTKLTKKWTLIGTKAPYYSKSESDGRYVQKDYSNGITGAYEFKSDIKFDGNVELVGDGKALSAKKINADTSSNVASVDKSGFQVSSLSSALVYSATYYKDKEIIISKSLNEAYALKLPASAGTLALTTDMPDLSAYANDISVVGEDTEKTISVDGRTHDSTGDISGGSVSIVEKDGFRIMEYDGDASVETKYQSGKILNGANELALPNKNGTIALLSDIVAPTNAVDITSEQTITGKKTFNNASTAFYTGTVSGGKWVNASFVNIAPTYNSSTGLGGHIEIVDYDEDGAVDVATYYGDHIEYGGGTLAFNSIATKTYVNDIASTLKTGMYQVVASLPTKGEEGVVYLKGTAAPYEMYVWESNAYIDLGSTDIDLSGYVSTTGEQTISGKKKFTNADGILVDSINSTNGNVLVRYKSSESKNVFGGSLYPLVLMGSAIRPYYSNDGADFTGKELALLSDLNSVESSLSESIQAVATEVGGAAKKASDNTFSGTNIFTANVTFEGASVIPLFNTKVGLETTRISDTSGTTIMNYENGVITFGNQTSYSVQLLGKDTRPGYNGNDLALLSDITPTYCHDINVYCSTDDYRINLQFEIIAKNMPNEISYIDALLSQIYEKINTAHITVKGVIYEAAKNVALMPVAINSSSASFAYNALPLVTYTIKVSSSGATIPEFVGYKLTALSVLSVSDKVTTLR